MGNQIEAYGKFLDTRYPNSSTSKHYISDLSVFRKFIGNQAWETVTPKTIDKFVQAQSEKQLKATTINRRLSSIASFFDFLQWENEQETLKNPVYWKRHGVKEGKRLPRDISDENVRRLFAVINNNRDKAIFTLMLNAGLRVGEIVGLTMESVEQPNDGSMSRLRLLGKGNKERMVWLTHETMYTLQNWLDERPACANRIVFLNQHKRPMSVSGVQHRLKQYCIQAGVSLTCHQLRHTFARRLSEHEMPVDSLAKLMGHASIQTTQHYIDGANPEVRRDFFTAMSQSQPDLSPNLSGSNATRPETPLSEVTRAESSYQSSQSVAAPPLGDLPIVKPSPPQSPPIPQEVWTKVQHLTHGIPEWLTPVIRDHLLRRIPGWAPHRAKVNAAHHLGKLAIVVRWLVHERGWQQLDQLRRQDLEAYLTHLQNDGLKPGGVRSHLSVFRSFWRDMIEQELATNGTVLQVKLPKLGHSLPRYLTESEFNRLEQAVNDLSGDNTPDHILNRTWFYLLAHAGIRLGELLHLRVNDCDLSAKRLRIQSGKGNRDRFVPLTGTLVRLLHQYLSIRDSAATDHLLLLNGRPFSNHFVRRRLLAYGEHAHVDALSPHRLRHTLATILVNRGMPITSLQKFLGHQSLHNTLVYAQIHDHTLERQFSSAMASIEATPVPDWPQQLTDSFDTHDHSFDTMSIGTASIDMIPSVNVEPLDSDLCPKSDLK